MNEGENCLVCMTERKEEQKWNEGRRKKTSGNMRKKGVWHESKIGIKRQRKE